MSIKKNKQALKQMNEYKIEQLGPRLMMDASVDDWHAEIDSINVSTSYSVNQFTAFENEPVEGLYQTTEDGLKQATIKDLLELNEIFDNNLSSESPNWYLLSVRTRLNAAVDSAKSTKLQELEQAALDAGGDSEEYQIWANAWLHPNQISISANEIYNALQDNSDISLINGMLDVSKNIETVFSNVTSSSSNLSSYIQEYLTRIHLDNADNLYKADINEISGVEANYEFQGISREYTIGLRLDGNSANGVAQTSSLALTADFNEKMDENSSSEKARFGILDLAGDTDDVIDLSVGSKIEIDANTNKSVRSAISANFTFAVGEGNLFEQGTFTNASAISLTKGFDGDWTWNENISRYSLVSMGKILGKLQDLSSSLRSIVKDSADNYAGLLAQNCNELLNISSMLEDVLGGRPQSIQELVDKLSASPYRKQSSNLILSEDENNNLLIPFHLQLNGSNHIVGKKPDGTPIYGNTFDVPLTKAFLEEKLGVKVLENSTVSVNSSATLDFTLVVPLAGSSKATSSSTLKDISLPDDELLLGSAVGTNLLIAGNRMNFDYGNSTTMNDFVASKAAGKSYCYDTDTGVYALYSDYTQNASEIENLTSYVGYVFSQNTTLSDNSTICYGDKKITLEKADFEHVASVLNSLFDSVQDFGTSPRAYAVGNTVYVLYKKIENVNNDTASNIGKITIAGSHFSETLNNIYISKPLPIKNIETSSLDITFAVDGGEPQTISIQSSAFDGAKSMADVAVTIHNQMVMNDISNVLVEYREGKIAFCSSYDFSITFGSLEQANWLGFNQASYSSSASAVKNSIRLEFQHGSTTENVEINLFALVQANGSNLSVEQIVNEIRNQVNATLSGNVLEITTNEKGLVCLSCNEDTGFSLNSIDNINGYTIASLLGLTGSVENQRKEFCVDATLANDENAVQYKGFTFAVTNTIQNGNVEIPALYGVFGTTIEGNLTGFSCSSTLNRQGTFGDLKGSELTKSYSASDFELGVSIASVNQELETLNFQRIQNQSNYSSIADFSIENVDPYFGNVKSNDVQVGFDTTTLFDLINEIVSENVKDYYFGKSQKTNIGTYCVPFVGRSFLDLMGLQSKFFDISSLLKKGASQTIQELANSFKKSLGVDFSFSLSSEGLLINLSYTKNFNGERVSLGGMDFGIENFTIGGDFEAYLTGNATWSSSILIAYDGVKGIHTATLIESGANAPLITGNLSIKAHPISGDMNVVYDGNGYPLLQVVSSENQESYLALKAVVNGNSLNVNFGGLLNVAYQGTNVGQIKIGVKQSDGTVSVWNDRDENDTNGLLHFTPNAVITSSVVSSQSELSGVSNGSIVLDFSSVSIEMEKIDVFDRLRQVADGMDDAIRRFQSGLNSELINDSLRHIPFIGNSIVSAADCLDDLRENFLEPFRKYIYKAQNLTVLSFTERLYQILQSSSLLKPCENIPNGQSIHWAGKVFTDYFEGIQFYSSENPEGRITEIGWKFRLGGSYPLDKYANFDLGMPGLGLSAEGGVRVELDWTLDIGFGVSLSEGAFILLSNGHGDTDIQGDAQYSGYSVENETDWHAGDDLKIAVKINPTKTSGITGSLDFLSMSANLDSAQGIDYIDNNGASIYLSVDLNDGKESKKQDAVSDWNADDKANTVINVGNLGADLSVEANLRANLNLLLDMTLGFGSSMPQLQSKLDFRWTSDFGEDVDPVKYVAFKDTKLNVGNLLDGPLATLINKAQSVLKPIQPLIDFLQAEIPVLNKLPAGGIHITVLDLIKQYGKANGYDFRMIDDIIELNNVVKKLDGLSDKGIEVDNWVIYEKSDNQQENRDRNQLGLSYLNGMIADKEKFVDGIAENFFDGSNWHDLYRYLDNNDAVYDATSVLNSFSRPTDEDKYGWSFPILDDSARVIYGMLMGNHADLVKFNMHPLEFYFDWNKSFAIVGPLFADIGFNFGVCIDLAFGYDTCGLEEWAKSGFKDVGALTDGFYVDDWNADGKDIAEVVFHSGIVAGASVAGRAGIDVGLNFNINMDLIDPNADGKIRLGELAETLSLNPLDTFDFSADINAEAFAYLDYFIGRKEWTLWSSGSFDLFDTAKEDPKPVLATKQGDDLVVNIGEYAAKRNVGDLSDGDDSVTIEFTESNKCKITYGDNEKTFDVTGTLFVYAGNGNDNVTITGTAGCNVEIHGGAGNDQIDLSGLEFAGSQYAVIYGDGGNDIIKGAKNNSTNFIFGEGGRFKDGANETVAESYPTDKSSGNNVIVANGGKNYIFGGFGNDFIVGCNGIDYVFGDGGRLTIAAAPTQGGKDNTSYDRYDLFDEGGDDTIFGGNGDDVLLGGAGSDSIDGGAGADEIRAGMGNDVVYGGSGTDEIYGDNGVDVIFGDKPHSATKTIADDATQGVLPYAYVSDELKKGASLLKDSDSIKLFGFATKFNDGNSGAALTAEQRDIVDDYENGVADSGSSDDDEIYGGNGSDIIFGDDGADGASASGGNDVIEGGADNDFIDGDAGDDRITGGSGEDVIYGGQGNDTLDGGAGNDIVFGDDGWADINGSNESASSLFGDNNVDNLVFGYTLAGFVNNFGILPDATSVSSGGKDFIYAGNGSDVVDGQGSDDVVLVNFMGEFYQAYTNVFDSGSTFGDELAIEGTIANDDVLIRASDAGLGLVALLPVEGSDKSKLERVNFWKTEDRDEGVDIVSVDTGAGADRITLDGTLSAIAIDSGAGDDEIFVGQQFDTERSAAGANVQAEDLFSTEATMGGHLSAGVKHATSITAGSGDDTVTVLHTSAPLALSGKSGDDTFNIHLFVDDDNNPIMNGPVTVIGGTGEDLLNVVGSEGDDTFVYTSEGVSASGVSIQSISIESDHIYGGKGDDSFYLLSSRENQHVYMEGGDGNDSFYNGGVQTDEHYIQVENRDYRGHNGIIEHTVSSTSSAYASGPADSIGVNIIDNDSCPVEVLFTDAMGHITEPRLTLAEGGVYAEYYVRLSRALAQGETVTVTVFAPTVTRNDRLRGDAGVVFVNESGAEIGNSVTFTFTAGMGLGSNAHVRVKAKSDSLREGDDHAALLHKVEYSGGDGFEVGPVRNVLAFVDDRTISVDTTRPFVVVDEFGVGTRSSSIELDNDSSVRLAYELANDTSVFNLTVENQVFTIHSEASRLNGEKYCYRAFGNQLVICCVDGDNVTPQSVSGILSAANGLTFATVADDANGLGITDDSLPGTVKIRHNDSSTDVAEGYTGSPTELYTDYYTITLNGTALAEDETVTVSIRPALTPYAKGGEKIRQVEVYKILDGNGVAYTNLTQVVFDSSCFDALGNCRVYRVYVRAIDDSVTETDDLTLVPVGRNTIEHIHGTTHEDGGGSNGPELPETKSMIRYSNDPQGTSNDEQDPPVESEGAEEEPFDETRSVDRVFVNNMDYNPDATSALHGLGETPVAGRSQSDSALLESDAESLRFTHSAIHATGMNLGNMEYGEFNLGNGVDTVDVSRSLYRDPGVDGENDFQEFTVINSGRGNDVITVNSYQDGEDDQLVINAGEGNDTVAATGANVTKEGLIVFGGLGDDTIDISSDSSLVFGDRGQVLYHDDDGHVVTRLGDDRTGTPGVDEEDEEWNAGGSDYATGKNKDSEAYWQTDGVRRGPSIARTVTENQGGNDVITLADGRNVVFGGVNATRTVPANISEHENENEVISTGNGNDLVFGDDGYATFGGHASIAETLGQENVPETRTEATLSFNFMGASQTGLSSEDVAGAADFAKANWNNVGGSLAGTYGNDDREIVRFDDNTRASAVSVSYGGIESHRNTSTDNRINLQAYGHNLPNASTDADAALMNSGYMTTAPGNQCDNRLEVAVDGLAQYFTDYRVAVYLDMPDANSWEGQSIRKVSLYVGDSTVALQSFYVNDCAGSNFNGTYKRSEYTSAEDILADLAHNAAVLSGELTGDDAVLIDTTGNYVVFEVPAGVAADSFRVIIEDGYTLDNINGKDIPGIAAIQVKGTLHAQDVAASTDIAHGGADTVYTSGGDDIVVGGTGGDTLTTYGDEHYGIYDNDVVLGDNAKMVFTDRDSSEATASTLSLAESLDSRTVAGDYNDHIYTGDGNDVVVGGQGADHIESGATAAAETMLDGIQVASFNFTRENATASEMVGETAGVVADNDWTNLYIKNNGLHVVGENYTNDPVTHDGIGISLVAYDTAVGDGTQNSSLMPKDDAQLDGDTSNSKLFNAYYAAQQQQEIKLTLTNLDSFAGGAPCDVYVYLGGDQQNTDTYNYLFDVWGHQVGGATPDQHYYLNDWTGSHFDGDYRLVECATAPTADELLSQVAPDMSLVGNYVVFRGVSSSTFEVRIRNLFTDTNQWPLNLPVITAVQVVAGTNREEDIAVGGDHDKDLVFGDDARVTFDIDTPFARNENLADYANRAIEAESMHFDGAAVEIPLDENDEPVETGDTILTGKDRDVIVGGDFGDTITMGDGDDVALGDNASIILEHNNPVGVFAPSVEIMLEQHTVTTSTPEVFLGNNDTDAGDIQDKFENGGVPGVAPETSENGATDTFTDTTDKDWTIQQEVTPGTISRTIDISSGAQVVNFAEGETVLLVSDTWPGNQWWHPNIVMVADGQGHSVPALEWEWDVNGTTMTATTQPGYYFTVDIPDTPNGDNRYEIRVTALTAGTAVISIGA